MNGSHRISEHMNNEFLNWQEGPKPMNSDSRNLWTMIIEHYSMNNKIGPSSSIGRIKPFKISVWEIKHTSGSVWLGVWELNLIPLEV